MPVDHIKLQDAAHCCRSPKLCSWGQPSWHLHGESVSDFCDVPLCKKISILIFVDLETETASRWSRVKHPETEWRNDCLRCSFQMSFNDCFQLAFRGFQRFPINIRAYFIEENKMNKASGLHNLVNIDVLKNVKNYWFLQYLLWPALFPSICGHWPFVGSPKCCTSFLLPPAMPVAFKPAQKSLKWTAQASQNRPLHTKDCLPTIIQMDSSSPKNCLNSVPSIHNIFERTINSQSGKSYQS